MTKQKILIVEDEQVVAEDLRRLVTRLGYEVVGTAANAEDALRLVEEKRPHMVLMDIRIQGPIDGIEVAEQIYTEYEIPVSYLTAYADESTLERAKSTLPFGYILKPFEERTVQTTIELALYRNEMEKTLKRMDDWHAAAMQNLSEAVVAEDSKGRVVYMNHAAETLVQKKLHDLLGKPMKDVFSMRKENGRTLISIPGDSGSYVGVSSNSGPEGGLLWILKAEAPARPHATA